jgi:hypothetical protein
MNAVARIRLLDAGEHAADAAPSVLTLPNDADPRVYALEIAIATRVDLHFVLLTGERIARLITCADGSVSRATCGPLARFSSTNCSRWSAWVFRVRY